MLQLQTTRIFVNLLTRQLKEVINNLLTCQLVNSSTKKHTYEIRNIY